MSHLETSFRLKNRGFEYENGQIRKEMLEADDSEDDGHEKDPFHVVKRVFRSYTCKSIGLAIVFSLIIIITVKGIFFFCPNVLGDDQPSSEISKIIQSPLVTSSPANDHITVINEKLQSNFELIKNQLNPPPISDPPNEETGLPYEPLLEIIERWNPDDPEIPKSFKERLQYFDFGNPKERDLAEKWRNAELPFKLYNVSDFHEISRLWNDDYLETNLNKYSYKTHVEKSNNNHFMFWTYRGLRLHRNKDFKPPTEVVNMKFKEWLQKAKEADLNKLSNDSVHYYFMMGADAHENGRTFISRDVPLFSTSKNNFFITNVKANKGIQCRFSMRGVIAECHYDSGKNFVAMLRGQKRYILTPPRTCNQIGIIPDPTHPSYRHSTIDWSNVGEARANKFDQVDAIETIVRTGELLYIPSFWFHYISSLEYSIQCNSRSGFPESLIGQTEIKKCFNQ